MTARERGSVSVFAVIMTGAMILAAGLVIDGGAILAARRDAAATADSAARAAAQALDQAAVRNAAQPDLDPRRGVAAGRAVIAAAGHPGDVRVEGRRVTVTVHVTQPLYVLGLAALGSKTVTASATARTVRGVTQPDQ